MVSSHASRESLAVHLEAVSYEVLDPSLMIAYERRNITGVRAGCLSSPTLLHGSEGKGLRHPHHETTSVKAGCC